MWNIQRRQHRGRKWPSREKWVREISASYWMELHKKIEDHKTDKWWLIQASNANKGILTHSVTSQSSVLLGEEERRGGGAIPSFGGHDNYNVESKNCL